MNKKEFYNNNDKAFFDAGFERTVDDELFLYFKQLISEDEIENHDLEDEEVPTLLFGTNGINSGFAVYTGTHFIWIDSETPKDASDFADKILSFDTIFWIWKDLSYIKLEDV